MVVVVEGNGEVVYLSTGIFWSGSYFPRTPFSVVGAWEGVVGLGGFFWDMVVRLWVGCCVATLRDDWYSTAEGGVYFPFFSLLGKLFQGSAIFWL